MAKLDFLLQAVTARFHADELRKLCSQEDCKRVLGSVAFVLQDGVSAIAPQLKQAAKVATFFVGIRNDITSIQAIKALLDLSVKVFAVDTGTRSVIFHPKLFLAEGKTSARLLIGSANLTFSGLHNNIEAGALLELDLETEADKQFLDSLLKTFDELPARFPDHIFQIKDVAAAEALFDQGRLIDEDVVRAPTVVASVRKGNRDSLTAMKLRRHAPPKRKRMLKVKVKEGLGGAEAAAVVPVPSAPSPDFTLVWESDGLAERDLNVPSGTNTNPTGSMLWKKGAGEEFDQRHYFRDEVFAKLDWKPDAKQPHQERAIAKFHLVIKGLNYGVFDLKLSHDTRKNTETYKQGNSMTRVHWGKTIKPHIAKPDLLGRTMSLYRKEGNPPEFVIEVD